MIRLKTVTPLRIIVVFPGCEWHMHLHLKLREVYLKRDGARHCGLKVCIIHCAVTCLSNPYYASSSPPLSHSHTHWINWLNGLVELKFKKYLKKRDSVFLIHCGGSTRIVVVDLHAGVNSSTCDEQFSSCHVEGPHPYPRSLLF